MAIKILIFSINIGVRNDWCWHNLFSLFVRSVYNENSESLNRNLGYIWLNMRSATED